MTPSAAFLLLVDARLPTGSHAHSGGMEEAVAAGAVTGTGDLHAWLRGRLQTVGAVDAAFTAAAYAAAGSSGTEVLGPLRRRRGRWLDLDAEWAARTVSPSFRDAGRAQGRGLLRAARACWPDAALEELRATLPLGPPWPVALGAAGAAAACALIEVTVAAASASVAGPAWATTRLLGTDPFDVAAVLARLGAAVDEVAARALAYADPVRPASTLPAPSAPLLDLGAEHHATWEVRLFAS